MKEIKVAGKAESDPNAQDENADTRLHKAATHDVKIKILEKSDSVVNVFPYEASIAIAVKRKAGSVEIFLVGKNDEGIAEISSKLEICEGDGSVEAQVGDTKIFTF